MLNRTIRISKVLCLAERTYPSKHASGVEAARMRKKNRKPLRRKMVLRLPDLDHAKNSVLNSHEYWRFAILCDEMLCGAKSLARSF